MQPISKPCTLSTLLATYSPLCLRGFTYRLSATSPFPEPYFEPCTVSALLESYLTIRLRLSSRQAACRSPGKSDRSNGTWEETPEAVAPPGPEKDRRNHPRQDPRLDTAFEN